MSTNFEEIEKLFEFCVQNILLQICAEAITSPLGCHPTPQGLSLLVRMLAAVSRQYILLLGGMSIYETLVGIEFIEITLTSNFHESFQFFSVVDARLSTKVLNRCL